MASVLSQSLLSNNLVSYYRSLLSTKSQLVLQITSFSLGVCVHVAPALANLHIHCMGDFRKYHRWHEYFQPPIPLKISLYPQDLWIPTTIILPLPLIRILVFYFNPLEFLVWLSVASNERHFLLLYLTRHFFQKFLSTAVCSARNCKRYDRMRSWINVQWLKFPPL